MAAPLVEEGPSSGKEPTIAPFAPTNGELGLKNKGFGVLPTWVVDDRKCRDLRVLLIGKNGLRTLPTLLALHKLERLAAGKNRIQALEPGALPPSLQMLELGANQLSRVAPKFFAELFTNTT